MLLKFIYKHILNLPVSASGSSRFVVFLVLGFDFDFLLVATEMQGCEIEEGFVNIMS